MPLPSPRGFWVISMGSKAKDFLTAKISVPFTAITSPTFEKMEQGPYLVKDPKIDVPSSVLAEDMDIYSREAELGGMEVARKGWDTVEVSQDRETAVFKREGDDYVLDGVYAPNLAYDMPLTKIIEKNAVKDIEAAMDYEFLSHIDAAAKAMKK